MGEGLGAAGLQKHQLAERGDEASSLRVFAWKAFAFSHTRKPRFATSSARSQTLGHGWKSELSETTGPGGSRLELPRTGPTSSSRRLWGTRQLTLVTVVFARPAFESVAE